MALGGDEPCNATINGAAFGWRVSRDGFPSAFYLSRPRIGHWNRAPIRGVGRFVLTQLHHDQSRNAVFFDQSYLRTSYMTESTTKGAYKGKGGEKKCKIWQDSLCWQMAATKAGWLILAELTGFPQSLSCPIFLLCYSLTHL